VEVPELLDASPPDYMRGLPAVVRTSGKARFRLAATHVGVYVGFQEQN
jgi:hypothetical protein